MRAMLFIFLALILSFQGFAQDAPFSPITSIKIALENSYSSSEQKQLLPLILQEVRNLRKDQSLENKIPVYARSFKTLEALPQQWQQDILQKLLPKLSQIQELELISFQASKLYTSYYQDPIITTFYNQLSTIPAQATDKLLSSLIQGQATPEQIQFLKEKSKTIRKFYFDQVVLKDIQIHDGFELIDGEINLTKTELNDHINRVSDFHGKIESEALSLLSEISENKQIQEEDRLADLKKYVDRGNLKVVDDSINGAKAEKTFIFNNDKSAATLVSRVVLNNSENAYIVVPKGLDLETKQFKKYIMSQHRIAGNSKRGFKDLEILNEKVSEKNVVSCWIDHHCYDTPHSKYRLDRSKKYWSAKFKDRYTTRGRNVFILTVNDQNQVEKVLFSPRAKMFNPKWWLSGKALKEIKTVFYAKPAFSDWVTGLIFGSLNAGAILTLSSKSPEEAMILAKTAFAFSTVIAAHTETFQLLFKSWKRPTNIMANFTGTFLPFVIIYSYFSTKAGFSDATLNFLGDNATVAYQNIFNIFNVGIFAKYASEYWKGFVDAVSSAKIITGRFKDLKVNFKIFGKEIKLNLKGPDKFAYLYQGWHLLRSTFKNIAIESAVAGGVMTIPLLNVDLPTLKINGFEVLGASHATLTASLLVGAASTYFLIKAFKLDKKSDKAAQILKDSIPFRKVLKRINGKIKSLTKKFTKVKCDSNFLKS